MLISAVFHVQNTLESAKNKKVVSLASVFESLSFSILITDENLEFVYSNRHFNDYFKVKNSVTFNGLFDKDNQAKLVLLSEKALKLDLEGELDIDYLAKDGSESLLNIQVQRHLENDSSFVIFIIKDVTERREHQQLKAYRDSLEKMNIELDQFVYKTAHDLRAPLTNLIGLIGIMRNETDLDLLSTYFDLQEKSVTKMDDFIQKITVYTKNTRLPISAHKIDFKSLIDSVLNELMYYDKSEFVEKNVKIISEIDFFSDNERIEIILKNLLANSIKFSKTNEAISSLELNITTDANGCTIVLHDNGIGIPKSIQHKVFDMFYRGHASADGSGIGLYIVKETVSKLGGSIAIKSEEGIFTEITLILPLLKKG